MRPGAGEAVGTEVATGFRMAPTKAAEAGDFLEAAATAIGVGPAGLAAEATDWVTESHGLLGMVPLKPEGDFLKAGLAPATLVKGGGFFGTRLLGEGCLPTEEPGWAVFLGAAAAATALSSALLSSFTAAKQSTAR